jgi:putative selenate reductase FAD-binding subunit
MIINYHRPQTMEEARKLLAQPDTQPIAGGTCLSRQSGASYSVVDLQDLGLDRIHKVGDILRIGATVTLQSLFESPHTSAPMKKVLELEEPLNLRSMGTVAGTLVTCDGRSPFGTLMLALDSKLVFNSDDGSLTFGNYLPQRTGFLPSQPGISSKLITSVEIPLNVRLSFETVARTPLDKPIICAALVLWPSGRTRLTLGGWGKVPVLALDGNEAGGLQEAARAACSEAGDEWASAEYRMDMAGILVSRCLELVNSTN